MASSVLGRKPWGTAASNNSQSIIVALAGRRALQAAVLACLLHPLVADAQIMRSPDKIQLGAAALPGVGLQLGYVDAGDILTREAVVYADMRPQFGRDDEALQVSAAVGVSLRIVGGLETIGVLHPRIWDVHAGLRFGPSLLFRRNETLAEKNQRFSLFLDPFLRFTVQPRERLIYFLEAGLQRPSIRAGVWLTI